jgi:hypothetical protein
MAGGGATDEMAEAKTAVEEAKAGTEKAKTPDEKVPRVAAALLTPPARWPTRWSLLLLLLPILLSLRARMCRFLCARLQKVAATRAMEAAKEIQKKARLAAAEKSHLYSSTPSEDSVAKRIETWAEKIRKLELDIRNKDDNKEVALGTSKINYCDPRITVAWCKRSEVPIDRVFPKTLRDKFVWALSVPPDWQFEAQK